MNIETTDTLTMITIEESAGIQRLNEPLRFGIPIPKGKCLKDSVLCLRAENGEHFLQFTVVDYWADGSLKWVVFSLYLTIDRFQKKQFFLVSLKNRMDRCEKYIRNSNEYYTCSFKNDYLLSFPQKGLFVPFNNLKRADCINYEKVFTWKCRCIDIDNNQYIANISSCQIEETGINTSILKYTGNFKNNETVLCRFFARIYVYHQSQTVRCDFTIHNDNSAIHRGNLWDLGDAGSVYLKDLSFSLNIDDMELYYQNKPGLQFEQVNAPNNFEILQQSSGGKNWNSNNHIDHEKKSYRKFPGAIVSDGNTVTQHSRLLPELSLHLNPEVMNIRIKNFWQNFPKSISSQNGAFLISLFPCQNDEIYELQGGESKTHTIYFNFDRSGLEWVESPLFPKYDPEWITQCQINKYFTAHLSTDNTTYGNYINNIIDGDRSFFNRREFIDEYGWRNFGDFFADHESRYNKPGELNISHYNNQYDGLYWCLIQYLRSGSGKWFELANDLALHVRDIDIYKTEKDRFEFNGGMFWHTDHYFDAQTSSHRCYSKHNTSKNGISNSGGPSPQNCYTTGLLLHYFITGDKLSLETLELTCKNALSLITGPENKTDRANYFIKIAVKKLIGKFSRKIRPYTLFEGPARESANVLTTLVNGYLCFHKIEYLHSAEKLIKICVKPYGNLKKHCFNNAEIRWNYVMFLQGLIYYLGVKECMNQIDSCYYYAKSSFLYFVRWMEKNETFYLKNPEKLEYPNETWAAQDLRKSEIFSAASLYCDSRDESDRFILEAEKYYNKAFEDLDKFEDCKYFVRPMIIVLGNVLINKFIHTCPK